MHEMSIALNIVDLAVATARQNQARKINAVVLELGALSGVVREALEFCFSSACKGTPAEGAALQIEPIPAIAICEQCAKEFNADQIVSACPACQSMVFNVAGGRELRIRSINVD